LLQLINSIQLFYFQGFIFGGDWDGKIKCGLNTCNQPSTRSEIKPSKLKNENMIMCFLVKAVALLREKW
jgi:hypothetical protein